MSNDKEAYEKELKFRQTAYFMRHTLMTAKLCICIWPCLAVLVLCCLLVSI